jgi:NDP-sugar pyrophosphorylase family protein
VYVFNRAILESIPQGPASLERDMFPNSLESGVYAFEQHGMFIDIGTPEDYSRAQALAESLHQAASPQARFGS